MKTKMRKFGAWLMAAALAFAGAGAVQAATVAKIGETSYETLAAAFGAAKDGDTVELLAASYGENDLTDIGKLNDKNVIVVGLGMDKTELKVVYSKSASDVNKLHFQDLTLTINHSGYGMPYTQTLCGTYERVKFNGLIAVDHGTSSFTDCVFAGTTTGDEYILWQYAGVMLVERCTFKASASKGVVKLYCESSYEAQNLVKDCVFESVTGSKGCAIYASNSNNLEKPIYEMNIVGNTIPDGVAEYLASGDGLTVVNPVKDANGKITSGTFITANKNTEQVKGIIGGVVAEGVEIPELVNGQVVIGAAAPEVEVVTPTVSEEKGITQQIADQIASNTEVTKVEDTGLKAALAKDETLKDAEAVVKVELTKAAKDETGVLTYEIKPVVKGEGETPDVDISAKVVGKPITFRVPLTDAFTKFAKVTHKGTVDEISHVEVLGAAGSRFVELTFNHFSEVEFDPELTFPDLPETAVKVVDGFYQSATTYAASTDFYIVSKAGLEYLRDFVNRDRTDYSDGPVFNYTGNVFSGKTVHLLADIDLNNEPWVSIGWNADKKFCGSFNGENHTISNMKIVNETITTDKGFYAGLFGYLATGNTTFQNLTFNNVTVKNVSNYAGALCGRYTQVSGAIKNIKVTGTVDISATSFVGGIAGHNAAQMSNCSVDAAGQVKSTAGGWCGGIAGYVAENSATVVEKCSVKGGVSLTGTNIAVGGITGHVGGKNVIKDCTVEAAITGGAAGKTGAIAGKMEGTPAAEIVNNDSTKVVDGDGAVLEKQLGGAYANAATCIVGTGVTYDESGKINGGSFESLPESAIAPGFVPAVDPETGKTVVEVDPITGSGTEDDPYVISDLKGLKAFRDRVNAGNTYQGKFVKLGADIDLASVENWEPIGTAAHPFMGHFDGKKSETENYKISNVNIEVNDTGTGNANVGFFGVLAGENSASIANVDFDGLKVVASVESKKATGGVVGNCYNTKGVYNVHVTNGDVWGSGTYVGGIAGYTGYCDIFDCSFVGKVHSEKSQVGGIAGFSEGGRFARDTANAEVTAGKSWAGGIVGSFIAASGTGYVNDCVFTGTAKETMQQYGLGAGGICGRFALNKETDNLRESIVGNYSSAEVYSNGAKVDNPLGTINSIDAVDMDLVDMTKNNSWDMSKSNKTAMEFIVYGEDNQPVPGVEPVSVERNANLVGSVKDLEYVGSGVVEIAAGSDIAAKSLNEIKAEIQATDPTKTVEIVDGKVVVTENIAKIGDAMFPTLAKAFEAAAEMTGSADEPIVIELFPGMIEEGTVKLPSVLKNVKMVGAADKATTIKNTRIMASDGGAWDYENLTFEGVIYDKSQFVFTGWRTGACTAKNFAFIGNEFKNIVNAEDNAAIHFNMGANEPVNGLRVEGNVIDGVSGSQTSGICVTFLTGDFIVRNNTIANCAHREMNIGIVTTDGTADNIVITDNLIYGNVGEMQIYGQGAATSDSVSWNVSYNILDNNSTADSMVLYKTNPEKATFVLDHNYYAKNPDTNPGSFWLNGECTAENIESFGVYPYYSDYDKDALAAGASVREALRDLTGAVAAVVSVDGNDTNEFSRLSSALQAAQANEKVILLADTAEENVPLKLEQEIIPNGHAFTGTVDPALVPAGYDAKVTTPDGRVFSALAKVEVPIGESSVIKVRMEGTAENLKTVQANGRPLWANKALGIANDFVIKPQVERPEVGSKTISIKSNISDEVLEDAAKQRDGVSVKFQLAKKVGSVGTYVQFGEKQPKPEFTVEADEQEAQTFWKIQIFFEEEY